jgi:hypothetical protein
MVAPEQRDQFVRNLTVETTEAFFGNGIDTGLEYSFVMHQRRTNDAQSPDRTTTHARRSARNLR